MNGKRITGFFAAPISPVNIKEDFDDILIKDYVDFLVENNCEGLFCIGTTGSFPVFNAAKRKQYAESFIKHAAGRVPVCIHVGSTTEAEALDLAAHAAAAGADCLAAVPPPYFCYDSEALFQFFVRLASVAPQLPFYLYHIPGNSNNDLPPALVKRLCEAVPNLAGIKDSGHNYLRFMDYVQTSPKDFGVLMGTDPMCLAGLAMGAAGGICAAASHNPELLAELFGAYRAGDMKRAQKLQLLVGELRHLLASLPFLSARIEILRERGFSFGFPKPFRTLSQAELEKMRARLAELGEEFSYPLL